MEKRSFAFRVVASATCSMGRPLIRAIILRHKRYITAAIAVTKGKSNNHKASYKMQLSEHRQRW